MCISQADKQKDRPIKKLTTEEAELSNIKDRKRRIHCKGTQGKKGFELTKRPRNRREQIKSKRKEQGKREKTRRGKVNEKERIAARLKKKGLSREKRATRLKKEGNELLSAGERRDPRREPRRYVYAHRIVVQAWGSRPGEKGRKRH